MTVSGLSSATLQSLLSKLNTDSSSGGSSGASGLLSALEQSTKTAKSAASTTAGTNGHDPAFVLSASQQQAQTQLFSYSNLGALVNKTEGSLNNLVAQSSMGIAKDGLGRPLTGASVSLDVTRLATAQSVTTGSFPSASTAVLGTGTLEVSVGSGQMQPITINDGSLDGVAKSINDAAAGIAAAVKQNNDGSYSLQITGSNTGVKNSFTMSGISDLMYDPASGTGSLTATAQAADASYTANGVAATSSSNDNVQVAPGVVTSFSKTGPSTLGSPVGETNASGAAQTLVTDFNNLVAADPNAGAASSSNQATMTQALDQVAGQSFIINGKSQSLADFGISVGSNGQLSVDKAKLASAYGSDPASFNAVITQAAKAINTTLSANNGVGQMVKTNVSNFMTQLVQMPNLAEVLAGNSSSSGGFSSSGDASQLLSGMSA